MRLFILFLLFAFPAQAIEVTHSYQMCRILEQHIPRADVTYQPGVDVHGEPVVPADLNDSSGFQLPETIKIPLSVDLATDFGLKGFGSDELVAPLGVLEVTKDGRVLQNGKDLTDRAYVICKEAGQ